jgi:hypothetical protein
VNEGPGKSCGFAVFHLIKADTIQDTLLLLQKLANAMTEVTDEAAVRAIFPISFCVMRMMMLPDLEAEEIAKFVTFVKVYGQRAIETSAEIAILLFVEVAKVLERVEYAEHAATFAELALESWLGIPSAAIQFRTLNFLIRFVTQSSAIDMSVNGLLCKYAASFQSPNPLQSVILLINCATLF